MATECDDFPLRLFGISCPEGVAVARVMCVRADGIKQVK